MSVHQPSISVTAAIALGSNLGDRQATLQSAVQQIWQLGTVTAVSSFYVTDPVGYLHQPQFLNAAALLETTLPAPDLLDSLLAIERTFGRNRSATVPKGPRTLDLDLLLYGDCVLDTPILTLPHPAMHERRFVLAPLAEIAPDLRHPVLHRTMRELLHALPTSA